MTALPIKTINNKRVTAGDVMSFPVLKVAASWNLSDVVRFFAKYRLAHAPVVSTRGETLGIIDLSDIMSGHLGIKQQDYDTNWIEKSYLHSLESGDEQSKSQLQSYLEATTADELMRKDYNSIPREASIEEALHALIKYDTQQIYVTDEQRVVGIISSIDLVKVFTEPDQVQHC